MRCCWVEEMMTMMDSQLLTFVLLFIGVLQGVCTNYTLEYSHCNANGCNGKLHGFTYRNLSGKEVSLGKYAGYVTIVVNVASF